MFKKWMNVRIQEQTISSFISKKSSPNGCQLVVSFDVVVDRPVRLVYGSDNCRPNFLGVGLWTWKILHNNKLQDVHLDDVDGLLDRIRTKDLPLDILAVSIFNGKHLPKNVGCKLLPAVWRFPFGFVDQSLLNNKSRWNNRCHR